MSEDVEKLLMMFINDVYSGRGNIKKKTLQDTMRYVASDKHLQKLVNIGDSKALLKYRRTKGGQGR